MEDATMTADTDTPLSALKEAYKTIDDAYIYALLDNAPGQTIQQLYTDKQRALTKYIDACAKTISDTASVTKDDVQKMKALTKQIQGDIDGLKAVATIVTTVTTLLQLIEKIFPVLV